MEQNTAQGENLYMAQNTAQGGNPYMAQDTMQEQSAYMTLISEVKAARRHFSKLGAGFLAGSLLIFAVQMLALVIADAVAPGLTDDMNIYLLVSMMPMYLIGIPVLALLVRKLPAQKPQKRAMKPGQFAVSVIMAFSLMYVANIIGLIITMVIGLVKGDVVQNTLGGVVAEMSPLVVLFLMVFCAPIVEELVFRKLLVDRVVRYGQGTAVVLSGLMFGLFHGNLNQFMYASALGMFLAFLYMKTGRLRITIAIHMLINFMGSIVSMWVMKLLDLDAMANLETGDMMAVMEFVSENLPQVLIYMLYVFGILGVMIAGLVLFIVFIAKGRFVFERGAERIPKGERFRTVILNLGMGLYFILWTGMIIYQLVV